MGARVGRARTLHVVIKGRRKQAFEAVNVGGGMVLYHHGVYGMVWYGLP
jgi:hypothetical protein